MSERKLAVAAMSVGLSVFGAACTEQGEVSEVLAPTSSQLGYEITLPSTTTSTGSTLPVPSETNTIPESELSTTFRAGPGDIDRNAPELWLARQMIDQLFIPRLAVAGLFEVIPNPPLDPNTPPVTFLNQIILTDEHGDCGLLVDFEVDQPYGPRIIYIASGPLQLLRVPELYFISMDDSTLGHSDTQDVIPFDMADSDSIDRAVIALVEQQQQYCA